MTSETYVPNDWIPLNVADVTVEHKQGYYTSDKYNHDGVRLVRITDLQNPRIVYSEMPRINVDDKTFEQFKVNKGDFLIARSGAIGRYGIVTEDIPCIFGSYIIRFRFDTTIVDNDFMGLVFQSHSTQRQLQQFTQGASNQNINANNIKKITFIVPKNINEQHKIASILSKVDEHISHTEAIIEKTEELKKGLMQQLLTKGIGHTKFKKTEIGEIPEEWDVVKLRDISLNLLGGGTPSTANNEYWDGSIPWMTSAHINGRYVRHGQKYITQKGLEQSSTKLVPKDNVLFVTRVGVGKIAINLIDIAISQDITGIIIDKEKANVGFIYWKLLDVARKIVSLSQGSTIKGILKNDLANQNIALPPLSEQTRIANMLMNIETNIEQNQTYLSHLQELKKGLMQDLLTGKVRVTV